jgi:predicted nucleic acid-binding protein
LILVDTSIWIDHLRAGDVALTHLLNTAQLLVHPFVIGELALRNLRQRDLFLTAISDLPRAEVATDVEVLHFVDRHALFGVGIGYVNAHLLAATRLKAGTGLWTRDKPLAATAGQLGLAAYPAV